MNGSIELLDIELSNITKQTRYWFALDGTTWGIGDLEGDICLLDDQGFDVDLLGNIKTLNRLLPEYLHQAGVAL